MASFENAKSVSLIAGSDFTGDLHKLVEVTGANTVDIVNATTDHVAGVVGEEVTAGVVCPVVLLQGRVKVLAGGVITAGQILVPAADGSVTGVANLGAIPLDSMGVGIALTGGASGEVIEMLAQPIAAPHTA